MNPETAAERGKGDLESKDSIEDANARWHRTAVAAFYRAEARGFAPGGELEDWLAAERELDVQSPAPAAFPADVEPVTRPQRPQGSAAKGPSRSRKSESSTGRRHIGGMA